MGKLDKNELINILKKLISASIRVASNDYVTVYNNEYNDNSDIKLLDNSYMKTYNLLEDSLYEYLIKYYGLNSSKEDLSIIGKNNNTEWFLHNNKTLIDYPIKNTLIINILNYMGMYRNILSCYYDFDEKDMIPKTRFDSCGKEIETKIFNSYKKVKSFK